jgi:hypothetical protein
MCIQLLRWRQLQSAWILYIDWRMAAIAISLDCILLDIDGGFDGGLFDQFHLAVLGYQPQQSIQQLSQEAFTAVNREGVPAMIIVMNPL